MKSMNLRRRLGQGGFAHHFIMPVLAIVAVVGIGTLTLHLSRASAAQYYNGGCTSKTVSAGANAGCVGEAKDLLNALQHANWRGYRTATSSIPGQTFAYGGEYYLDMNNAYDGATQAALKKSPFGVPSLTGGTDPSDGWQLFCSTVAKSGIQLTSNKYDGKLDFKNGNKTNDSMNVIFNAACGNLTLAKAASTSTSGTASGSGHCTNYTFSMSSRPSGAPGSCVKLIQEILNGVYAANYHGTYDSHVNSFASQTRTATGYLTADNAFGAATQSQVEAFQGAYNNLHVDGVVGSGTWNALCGEAMSFKPDSETHKKTAYHDASSSWSGCSASARQASYGIHATVPTVGVPVVASGGGSGNTGSSSSSSSSKGSGGTNTAKVAGTPDFLTYSPQTDLSDPTTTGKGVTIQWAAVSNAKYYWVTVEPSIVYSQPGGGTGGYAVVASPQATFSEATSGTKGTVTVRACLQSPSTLAGMETCGGAARINYTTK